MDNVCKIMGREKERRTENGKERNGKHKREGRWEERE